mgnify:CR=1 FL=1
MTTKHTAGPWKIEDGEILPGDGVVSLGTVYGVECAANARLIAAAPELLAACLFAIRCIDHPHPRVGERLADQSIARRMVREAVAKATGEA